MSLLTGDATGAARAWVMRAAPIDVRTEPADPAVATASPDQTDGPLVPHRRRLLTLAALVAGTFLLFYAYLRLSRAIPTNADGAANTLQAWEMLHGNVLLRGWTVTDVSFYTTELVQYALIQIFYPLNHDVVHVAAAMTYTLLILLAAAVAKGRSTGRAAVLRVGLVLAIMLVPTPGLGPSVLLLSPDHTGTGVPLLAIWLVIDRFGGGDGRPARRWLPWLVAVMLVWAQAGDPLALFIGALPLAAVSAWRLLRDLRLRGTDLHLLVASVTSVPLTYGLQLAVWSAGGFSAHPPIAEFATRDLLVPHLETAVKVTAVNFGAYFPALHGPLEHAAGVVNLVGLLLAACALVLALVRLFGRRGSAPGDRVADLLCTAILVNLAAFVASTQPGDLGSARQVVAVLPFGAALTGRLLADRLLRMPSRPGWPRQAPILASALAVLAVALGAQVVTSPTAPAEAHEAAEWLQRRGHTFGLGSYWTSNNITVATRGKVRVAPLVGGYPHAFRWESRVDWYDPAVNDARFVVIDKRTGMYGDPAGALAQFGVPVTRKEFREWSIFVYDRNLLIGLKANCAPDFAPSMRECPPLPPRVPGASLLHGDDGDTAGDK